MFKVNEQFIPGIVGNSNKYGEKIPKIKLRQGKRVF